MLKARFLDGKRPSSKAWHHKHSRIGLQRKSPQNNFRRLIACSIPAGQFCCESISYFPANESRIPLAAILALLNSKLLEWYFRLGSSNAMINDYQVRTLPAPNIDLKGPKSETTGFIEALEKPDIEAAFSAVEPLLESAPFPPSLLVCLSDLTERISKVEAHRGNILRSERSSLAPEGQPYQDLIDRILYRAAGLTDAEAAALERRLKEML